MKHDFNAVKQQAEKEYNLNKGEYFKVKEGANKVRLVSVCLPHESFYKGQKTFKWLCQVIDLTDGKVKPYFMPHTVYKQICDLQIDDDYKFEGVPMPYSINIQTTNAGQKEVNYSVIPSPKSVALTAEQLKAIESAPTVQELQDKVRENEKDPQEIPPATEMTPEEKSLVDSVPF
jgi:hypothetical protein